MGAKDFSQASPPDAVAFGPPPPVSFDIRLRKAILWTPRELEAYQPPRQFSSLPREVTTSLLGVAMLAGIFFFSSTLVFSTLTLVLLELHRELFQPSLYPEHYLEALMVDYINFFARLRKRMPLAIAGLIFALLLLFVAPAIVTGVFGAAAVLLILYWIGITSKLRLALMPVENAVNFGARNLRSCLDAKVIALLLAAATVIPPVWLFCDLFVQIPDSSQNDVSFVVAHAKLVIALSCFAALLLTVPWISRLCGACGKRGDLGAAILTMANGVYFLSILALFCRLGYFWSAYPYDYAPYLHVGLKTLAVGIVLDALFWWKYGRGPIGASNDPECHKRLHYSAWSALTLVTSGTLLWLGLGMERTNISLTLLYISIIGVWFFQVKLLFGLMSGEGGALFPHWMVLHLATMASMLVAFLTLLYSGIWGLAIGLAAISLILSNVPSEKIENRRDA